MEVKITSYKKQFTKSIVTVGNYAFNNTIHMLPRNIKIPFSQKYMIYIVRNTILRLPGFTLWVNYMVSTMNHSLSLYTEL